MSYEPGHSFADAPILWGWERIDLLQLERLKEKAAEKNQPLADDRLLSPAPWFARETDFDGWYVVDKNGGFVCHVGEGANSEANARLLAEAPVWKAAIEAIKLPVYVVDDEGVHVMGSTDDALADDGCCAEENGAYAGHR